MLKQFEKVGWFVCVVSLEFMSRGSCWLNLFGTGHMAGSPGCLTKLLSPVFMLSKANWQVAVAEKGICKNVELIVSCQEANHRAVDQFTVSIYATLFLQGQVCNIYNSMDIITRHDNVQLTKRVCEQCVAVFWESTLSECLKCSREMSELDCMSAMCP